MKLRARTDFDISSTLESGELIKRTQSFLDRFCALNSRVIVASAVSTDPQGMRLDLVLAPMTYGEAEELVAKLGAELAAHLESCDATEVEEREIELVPA